MATFNSGFKMKDSGGGVAVGGHTYAPMKQGLGTVIRYRDGHVDVVAWPGGPDVGADVQYARQNLPLIVNHGRPNPNLSDGPEWGFTLGNAIRVWRSAVGIDRRGNLIYVAAPDQTVGSLAAIMIRARAVRAMELDINTYWTTFIHYRHPGAVGAANLLREHGPPVRTDTSPRTIAISSRCICVSVALAAFVAGCGGGSHGAMTTTVRATTALTATTVGRAGTPTTTTAR